MNENNYKDFYIAIKDNDGKFLIYCSESYKFSELDILNLIKMCILERRSVYLGKRILSIYEDSTNYSSHRIKLSKERLRNIGLETNNEERPTKYKNSKVK